MKRLAEYLIEQADDEHKPSLWIMANKTQFMAEAGNDWEALAYAAAYEMYVLEPLDERLWQDVMTKWFGRQFNKPNYEQAVSELTKLVKAERTGKSGHMRHDIYYYAGQIAKKFVDVDARELAELFQSAPVKLTESEAATNTTGGVAAPDAPKLRFKTSKVAGCDCVEVDAKTYDNCKFGKKKYSRWSGYVEDEELRTFIQKNFKQPKKMMLMNADTGAATLFKS